MKLSPQKLEFYQADNGLTTSALAQHSKITLQTIYAAKKGKNIRIPTLTKLAEALGCKPSDLLEGSL